MSYLVIRIHPTAPVDPISFSQYLLDLQIQIKDAATGNLLGQTPVNSAPVVFWSVPEPGGPTNHYQASFLQVTSGDTKTGSVSLPFATTAGIPIGSQPVLISAANVFDRDARVSQVSGTTTPSV